MTTQGGWREPFPDRGCPSRLVALGAFALQPVVFLLSGPAEVARVHVIVVQGASGLLGRCHLRHGDHSLDVRPRIGCGGLRRRIIRKGQEGPGGSGGIDVTAFPFPLSLLNGVCCERMTGIRAGSMKLTHGRTHSFSSRRPGGSAHTWLPGFSTPRLTEPRALQRFLGSGRGGGYAWSRDLLGAWTADRWLGAGWEGVWVSVSRR
jgi:hypothetical protein